jgi:hypothetical protein
MLRETEGVLCLEAQRHMHGSRHLGFLVLQVLGLEEEMLVRRELLSEWWLYLQGRRSVQQQPGQLREVRRHLALLTGLSVVAQRRPSPALRPFVKACGLEFSPH